VSQYGREKRSKEKNVTKRIVQTLSLTVIIGLLLSVVFVAGGYSTAEAASVVITVDAPAEVVKGSEFSVSVDTSSVTAFDAGQFDVSFNSSMMQLDGVDAGLIGTTQIPVSIWNMVGSETCRVVVNVPGIPGVDGSGYLAVLRFHATDSGVGSGALSLSNGFLNNNLGTEITATWTGDSVAVCEDLLIATTTLPDNVVGSTYSCTLAATGGNGSYTWSISSGTLPSGLSLSSTGTVSGTSTAVGEFTFTVALTDGQLTASKVLTINVIPRLGDANDDGIVNAADITKTEKIIVGLDEATAAADANQDSLVNSADITMIERIIAGLS
jgi:hypothetical protein